MGSRARIVVYAEQEPLEAIRRAFEVIDSHERTLCDYDPASEAMVLCQKVPQRWHSVSPTLIAAIRVSRKAWQASDGAFDVTIGAVSAVWREANKRGVPPTAEQLARSQDRVGMNLLELDAERGRVRLAKAGMTLDFGGIGKGLAADAALVSLRSDGINEALVEIGGDLVVGDAPPGQDGWLVRVVSSAIDGRPLILARQAAATSGDAFRFIEIDGVQRSHILQPRSGLPAPAGGAGTVVASSGWVADAIATVARLSVPEAARSMARSLGGAEVIEQS